MERAPIARMGWHAPMPHCVQPVILAPPDALLANRPPDLTLLENCLSHNHLARASGTRVHECNRMHHLQACSRQVQAGRFEHATRIGGRLSHIWAGRWCSHAPVCEPACRCACGSAACAAAAAAGVRVCRTPERPRSNVGEAVSQGRAGHRTCSQEQGDVGAAHLHSAGVEWMVY